MKLIAADFGASLVKISSGIYNGRTLRIERENRFRNQPIYSRKTTEWNIQWLFENLKSNIYLLHKDSDIELKSIGIDSWGVDFGLVDQNAGLVSKVFHYRDGRSEGVKEQIFDRIPEKELFYSTAVASMDMNTLFQLYSLTSSGSFNITSSHHLLMIADLFNYMLTGRIYNEYTLATTTQLYDQKNNSWATNVLDALEIPGTIFSEIIKPGELWGKSSGNLDDEIGIKNIPVVAVGSHDVASAVLGLPIEYKHFKGNWAFLILGTCSILGVENDNEIILDDEALSFHFTNEGGTFDKTFFEKVFTGYWLINEIVDSMGTLPTDACADDELMNMVLLSEPFCRYVDIEDDLFQHKTEDILLQINKYFRKTNQKFISGYHDILRVLYEGLVFKIRLIFDQITGLVHRPIEVVYVSGGLSNNCVLCQWIADALSIPVVAGLSESTQVGNFLMQLHCLGELHSINDAREVTIQSFSNVYYYPQHNTIWEESYYQYVKTTKQIG